MVKNTVGIIALVLSWPFCPDQSFRTAAQVRSRRRSSGGGIPAKLKVSLDERLQQFVQAQASGDWTTVSKMLGRYRGTGHRRTLYRASDKETLISHMQGSPMVSFTIDHIWFSTEILSLPASRRWWQLWGTAEFAGPAGRVTRKTMIVAYRDRGGWYFGLLLPV
ncbi:MAG TPA: hypothetical protein VEZ90_18765 [Blastocatellia bacterium]|nr:hypothetical protein [Blastocatellia bacterium]